MVKCAICGKEYDGEICPDCGGDVVILDFAPEQLPEEKMPVKVKSFAEKKEDMYQRNIQIAKENGLIIRQKQTAANNLQAKKRNEIAKKTKVDKNAKYTQIGVAAVMLCIIALFSAVNIWDNSAESKPVQASPYITMVEYTQAKLPDNTQAADDIQVTDAETEYVIEEVASEGKYMPLTASEYQYYFEDNTISATLEFTEIDHVSDYCEPQKQDNFSADDYVLLAELNIKNISDENITVVPDDLLLFCRSWSNSIASPVNSEKYGVPTAGKPFVLLPGNTRTLTLSFICKKE
ncbi:MAG: hypothetical protein ACI4JF_07840, partial [Oscillospiraceae bacterium]